MTELVLTRIGKVVLNYQTPDIEKELQIQNCKSARRQKKFLNLQIETSSISWIDKQPSWHRLCLINNKNNKVERSKEQKSRCNLNDRFEHFFFYFQSSQAVQILKNHHHLQIQKVPITDK